MRGDTGLDARLRDGMSSAVEAVDPAVSQLLTEATRRGRRRRRARRAWGGAAMLAAAVIPLTISLMIHSSVATTRQSAASAPVEVIGTWQTPVLPAGEWQHAYERAGGSSTAARAFLGASMAGPAHTYRIRLTVTDDAWTVYVSAGSDRPVMGWHGTYTRNGTRVVSWETRYGCAASYEVRRVDAGLQIHVVADTCGATDLLAQRTIYQTAAFQPAN